MLLALLFSLSLAAEEIEWKSYPEPEKLAELGFIYTALDVHVRMLSKKKEIETPDLALLEDLVLKANVEALEEYDQKVLAEFVKRFFPDFRRSINELQRYSHFGKIDVGILSHLGDLDINEVVKHIKEKDFGSLRKWVAGKDIDPQTLYRKLYDNLYEVLKKETIPQAVLILAEYQYKQAFVADAEINVMACLTELMLQCEFL